MFGRPMGAPGMAPTKAAAVAGGLYGMPGAPPPGGAMRPQPMPPAPSPAMGLRAAKPGGMADGEMSPQMQAGLRLGGGLLGAMQQQRPGERMGGLLGRAMLDPTMLQALQQMGQGWGRAPQLPGMPNMNAMGPGGTLGGGV